MFLETDTVIGEIYGGVAKKKSLAALLAFPLFGVTGIHRVYLGTQPYVPVVYMGTLGGLLVLPTIDFIAILAADKSTFESFQNNPHVFMWIK
ncbi:MAG: TM2 domain-containing protein [Bacteroidota bacterium]